MKQSIKTVEMHDDFECDCGNTSHGAGFYPCDKQGNYIEPTTKEWTVSLYKCDNCGQIFLAE